MSIGGSAQEGAVEARGVVSMFTATVRGVLERKPLLLCLGIGLVILGLVPCCVQATSRDYVEIEWIRTCLDVARYLHKFHAVENTSSFNIGQTVHCVLAVVIYRGGPRASYTGTLTWYKPNGDIYREHKFEELKMGYRWCLTGSITPTVPGEWRVRFSLAGGPGRGRGFSVSGASTEDTFELPEWRPSSEQAEEPVTSREEEPNDSVERANLIGIDSLIQGETFYHSSQLFDQDWYKITLPKDRSYWICVSFIGTRGLFVQDATGDLKLSLPYQVFEKHDMDHAIGGLLHQYFTTDYEKNTVDCTSDFEVRGPSVLYIRIFSELSDLVYSVCVRTSLPDPTEFSASTPGIQEVCDQPETLRPEKGFASSWQKRSR